MEHMTKQNNKLEYKKKEKYESFETKFKKYCIEKNNNKILNIKLKKKIKKIFLSQLYSKIQKKKLNIIFENSLIMNNYFKSNFGRVKKAKLNSNFLTKNLNKLDLYYDIKKIFKFNKKNLNFLNIDNKTIVLKQKWKRYYFFFFKKKIINKKFKKLRYRILFNTNLEVNLDIFAYIIISKEFFSFPKFLKIQPHFFTNKINKFIRHFF